MVFVDLHLHRHDTCTNAQQLFDKLGSNINYVYHLHKGISPVFVQYAAFSADFQKGGVRFVVKKAGRGHVNLVLPLLFWLRRLQPDVVLFHSLQQPWVILLAAFILKRDTRLMVQNHADRPKTGLRLLLQRLAARRVSYFLFVSTAQAGEWQTHGIIRDLSSVAEVMEGSTAFRADEQRRLHRNGSTFLWVGRLDQNKDPLTVLEAFRRHVAVYPHSRLHMIFGSATLLNDVRDFIAGNQLQDHVLLLGALPHHQLEAHYRAADFFVLGSHREGSGYALCEAMACGCIPIVSNIASFRKMTRGGSCGYLFRPGDAEALLDCMDRAVRAGTAQMRSEVLQVFEEDLSFKAIANRISQLIGGNQPLV